MTERTDEDLVAAFLAGDESAATELVHRHAGPVGRYLLARGAAPSDVEDLVQETFFRAFRGLGTWRGGGALRGWLLRIASNHHRDQHRRARGRQLVPLEDHDAADAADPQGELQARELQARLQRELDRLPRLQREVFLLRAQQGLDYPDICAALGTTPGAARVHFHHAVKRLKEAAL
jgi:RNA polymerase sigma-70 factor, ECF subfamily